MENVVFGVQLCIKISIFNEKSDFCYSDHPEITPGLHDANHARPYCQFALGKKNCQEPQPYLK